MRNKHSSTLFKTACVSQNIHIFNNTFYCQTLTSVVDGGIQGMKQGEEKKRGEKGGLGCFLGETGDFRYGTIIK